MRTFWRRTTHGRCPHLAFGVAALLIAAALAACSPSTRTKASSTPAASPTVTPVQLAKGWTNVPSPGVGAEGRLTAVTALSASDAWSVGQYAGADSLQRTLFEHWDGSQWKFVPSPNPGTQYNILQGVAGASATDVWAVGYQASASDVTEALIEQWPAERRGGANGVRRLGRWHLDNQWWRQHAVHPACAGGALERQRVECRYPGACPCGRGQHWTERGGGALCFRCLGRRHLLRSKH